ncbi:MAG: hypothetical protein ACOCQR_02155 [bacterium]
MGYEKTNCVKCGKEIKVYNDLNISPRVICNECILEKSFAESEIENALLKEHREQLLDVAEEVLTELVVNNIGSNDIITKLTKTIKKVKGEI